jgi:hypothetical protein
LEKKIGANFDELGTESKNAESEKQGTTAKGRSSTADQKRSQYSSLSKDGSKESEFSEDKLDQQQRKLELLETGAEVEQIELDLEKELLEKELLDKDHLGLEKDDLESLLSPNQKAKRSFSRKTSTNSHKSQKSQKREKGLHFEQNLLDKENLIDPSSQSLVAATLGSKLFSHSGSHSGGMGSYSNTGPHSGGIGLKHSHSSKSLKSSRSHGTFDVGGLEGIEEYNEETLLDADGSKLDGSLLSGRELAEIRARQIQKRKEELEEQKINWDMEQQAEFERREKQRAQTKREMLGAFADNIIRKTRENIEKTRELTADDIKEGLLEKGKETKERISALVGTGESSLWYQLHGLDLANMLEGSVLSIKMEKMLFENVLIKKLRQQHRHPGDERTIYEDKLTRNSIVRVEPKTFFANERTLMDWAAQSAVRARVF